MQVQNKILMKTVVTGAVLVVVVVVLVVYNAVAATILKWHTFKLLRWMQNLYQSTWVHDILYAGRSSEHVQLLFFLKTKNMNMATA
jgi:TRAP-type mannitol/chloroaromatic compound transport system permease small subunit